MVGIYAGGRRALNRPKFSEAMQQRFNQYPHIHETFTTSISPQFHPSTDHYA